MMISPETFFKMNIEGKSPAEISREIAELEQQIAELKKIIKDKTYAAWRMLPSLSARLDMCKEYLEIAKQGCSEAVRKNTR